MTNAFAKPSRVIPIETAPALFALTCADHPDAGLGLAPS